MRTLAEAPWKEEYSLHRPDRLLYKQCSTEGLSRPTRHQRPARRARLAERSRAAADWLRGARGAALLARQQDREVS